MKKLKSRQVNLLNQAELSEVKQQTVAKFKLELGSLDSQISAFSAGRLCFPLQCQMMDTSVGSR